MSKLVEDYAAENDFQRKRIRQLLLILREAHDLMDDYNARHNPEQVVASCMWCAGEGYDGDGLIHKDDCILRRIRAI